MNSSQQGIHFERWITNLYDQNGKLNVKHNVIKKKNTKKGKTTSQFDMVFGLFDKRYVECKYHSKGAVVTFADVSTFSAKLHLNNIAYTQGIMITNTGYETRARAYAHKVGITLIDRESLVKLDWKRTNQLTALVKGPTKRFVDSLERRIMQYKA